MAKEIFVKNMFSLSFLKSGWAILISASIGIFIGLFLPDYVDIVAPIGTLYLNILKMCILPILITAISVAIAKLSKSSSTRGIIKKILLVFLIVMLLCSAVGLAVGLLGQPGSNLDQQSTHALGDIIQSSGGPDLEVYLFQPYESPESQSLLKDFFFSLVPENIFQSLSSGDNLKVLFFAVIFGLAVGSLGKTTSLPILETLHAIYSSFTMVMTWLMYLLPFGLCGLIAANVSSVGLDILVAMMAFVPWILLSFGLIFVLCLFLIGLNTKDYLGAFGKMKEPLMVALATSNGLAALPSAMKVMHENFKYEKDTVDLVVPLAFTLCRSGPVVYFSIASIFVCQLYNVDMTVEVVLTVFLGAIIAGFATAGSSGIVMLSMLGLVLIPLSLPLDAVLVLFIVIDPIIAPLRVVILAQTSCLALTFVGKRDDKSVQCKTSESV
ncbi:dicarboxylate/amino acid:cation symporter [Catenovulum sediminis]|uniref:Cation:dicarboxylase symporter family transporter n=1 Tax=Catenovulum sediminis TaxID=1740262 RepID=A0ABV1RIE5_9ALTE